MILIGDMPIFHALPLWDDIIIDPFGGAHDISAPFVVVVAEVVLIHKVRLQLAIEHHGFQQTCQHEADIVEIAEVAFFWIIGHLYAGIFT